VRSPEVRLAEPLAALSLAGDLGMGIGLEHAIRVTYVAGRLAGVLGLDAEQRSNVFYVSLLHGIGCTADAHDLARVFATDEIALKGAGSVVDDDDPVAGLRLVLARQDPPGRWLSARSRSRGPLAAGRRRSATGFRPTARSATCWRPPSACHRSPAKGSWPSSTDGTAVVCDESPAWTSRSPRACSTSPRP
jgi:hypothetical protein